MFTSIIFDCDGTLVDTEIANLHASQILAQKNGADITIQDVITKYKGLNLHEEVQAMSRDYNITFPDDHAAQYVAQVRENFHKCEPIPHVVTAISHLHDQQIPISVASNGEWDNIIHSLKEMGLSPYFPEDRIFNAAMVTRPKPAPDLFIHAATKMGVTPDQALVVEDTTLGVKAAIDGGFAVWGFTGVAEDKEKAGQALRQAGASFIFDSYDVFTRKFADFVKKAA